MSPERGVGRVALVADSVRQAVGQSCVGGVEAAENVAVTDCQDQAFGGVVADSQEAVAGAAAEELGSVGHDLVAEAVVAHLGRAGLTGRSNASYVKRSQIQTFAAT
jgi:hypothetical protein